MRPEWKALLMVFLLLGVQAFSEMALPGYTSALVNVGVQQGGVPSPLAESLSHASLQGLLPLMDGEAERQAVLDAYRPEGEVYHLRPGLDAARRQAAEQALTLPMALSFTLENQPGGDVMLKGLRSGLVSRETLAASMKDRVPLEGAAAEQFLRQAAVQYVRAEYGRLGMDTDRVRNAFLWDQGLRMLGLTLLSGLAALLAAYFSSRSAARVGRSLRGRIYAKVLSFSRAEVDRFSTASLITRSTNDVSQVQNTGVMMMRMLFYAPLLAVGGIWRVVQANTGLGWIVAVTVVAMVLLVVFIARVVTPKFKVLQRLIDRMNLVSRENLTGVQVIRAFSREAQEAERFRGANRELTRVTLFINNAFSFVMPMMMLIVNVVVVLILWFGAGGIEQGRLQVGDMIAFISYTMQIAFSFMMMAMFSSVMLPRAEVAAQRVDEVLTTEPGIESPAQPQAPSAAEKGFLRFSDVSFRYPDSAEEVLHGLTFEVREGQTAAVIGATGSGKSTLLQLIPRFFDVTGGKITLDGVDLRDWDLSALRAQFGFVPQQAQLFSGTIQSNLKYADPDMDDARMERAARLAQAERFIAERGEGYDSPVAQGGSNLSGGQKQRLSIARAIAAAPRFLLFDDSFSALDYRTDLKVRQALKEELGGAGVIIVAQRIATVMQADRIIVLEDGRLAGQGTHRELMESCPAYQQIARSQLSDEELGLKGGDGHV